ncbi:hypothetical protein [Saccharibacillus alkalitolerans]|uniref:Uncharacterized protein n=1 Tax=Saccharibacillus alkalitolerans TaxID=2705290 RepID=A0ABX0EYL9_9BACL|nr:hypothetical protein [Saccharibacillus alkalitolerans]NGZ73838.1 hypothetical protein [Saccharibacillus alkalitolerans]
MPQFLEWIMSNFFVVIIIVGALLSVFGKKNGKPADGGGEPFGGRGASRPSAPRPSASARPAQLPGGEGERRSPFAGAPEQQGRTSAGSPRRPASEGRRSRPSERTDLEQASRQMSAEIERRLKDQRSQQRRTRGTENSALQNGRSSAAFNKGGTATEKRAAKPPVSASSSRPLPKIAAEELRKGIMWAEILSEPRARKPYSSGRR